MPINVPFFKTWKPGDIPQALDFNIEIHDTIALLRNPPQVQVFSTADLAVAGSTNVLLNAWDTVGYDTDTMHNPTYPSRLTAQTIGRYRIYLETFWQYHTFGGHGCYQAMIRKNAAGLPGGGTAVCISVRKGTDNINWYPSAQAVGDVILGAGDYVEGFVFHTYGSTTNLINSGYRYTRFSAVWISTG